MQALELNFLEGANIKPDYEPEPETKLFMSQKEPNIPDRDSYVKPGDQMNQINKIKQEKMALQQARLGKLRNQQNELRMASQQHTEIDDPDLMGCRENLASMRSSVALPASQLISTDNELDFIRSTTCNSRPMTKSQLRSHADFSQGSADLRDLNQVIRS